MGYPIMPATPAAARPAEGSEIFRRMVEEFYGVGHGRHSHGGGVWSPPTDVYETHGEIVIKMAVPGIQAGDVRVVFNGDAITISGHRHGTAEAGIVSIRQMEIRTGYFERTVLVSQPYDGRAAKWDYDDGILWLRIPKAGGLAARVFGIRLRV